MPLTYQTLQTVFHHITKQRQEKRVENTTRSGVYVAEKLRRVWRFDETLSQGLDIISQSELKLRRD